MCSMSRVRLIELQAGARPDPVIRISPVQRDEGPAPVLSMNLKAVPLGLPTKVQLRSSVWRLRVTFKTAEVG
jgi:hypothetical protein